MIEGILIHKTEHQDFAGVCILHNGGNQSLFIEFMSFMLASLTTFIQQPITSAKIRKNYHPHLNPLSLIAALRDKPSRERKNAFQRTVFLLLTV
jgi:hypothetical protein